MEIRETPEWHSNTWRGYPERESSDLDLVALPMGHGDCCLMSQRGQRGKLVTSQGVHFLTLVIARVFEDQLAKAVSDEAQLPAGFLSDLIAWISASNWAFLTSAHTKQQLDLWGAGLGRPYGEDAQADCSVAWKVASDRDRNLEKRCIVRGPDWQIDN